MVSNVRESAKATFRFKINGVVESLFVTDLSVTETISSYYFGSITLSTSKLIECIKSIPGKEAVLTIGANESDIEDRYFHGIVNEFKMSGKNGKHYMYHAQLVPRLWYLSLRRTCRIFQEMNVQDIVKEIIEEHGITSQFYKFAIMIKQRKRGFCVQYRESDLDFINRLLQEEGIFYFFNHQIDRHVLVISDDQAVHPPIKRDKSITFNSGGMLGDKECVTAFSFYNRLGPQAYSHNNFYFKKPTLNLTSKKSSIEASKLEIYEYPALHTTEERGDQLAKIRMEELIVQQQLGYGESSCAQLTPGHIFTLTHHESHDLNIDYLVLSVTHAGVQPQSLQEASEGGFFYDARFYAIPASVPYRPPMTIAKPSIAGLQTAIVVGPPGKEIYTDDYGRIKVRFHWDRSDGKDGNSSCWLRINQPWSGSRWGMIAIPRVGDEVLIAFLEGDPDRPIMVGNVNNADSPALYQLPANQTQIGIRTQSTPNGTHENFNELRFEDKKGSEHIYLQGERDWDILIKNDKSQTVGHDEALKVQNSRTKVVGVDQSEVVGCNKSIEVGANHSEKIGANMTLKVGATKTETVTINSMENVGLAKELSVGGAYALTVIGGMNTAVGLGQYEEVGLNKQVVVGKSFKIQANDTVEIVCGKSTLKMDSAGNVTINGHKFDFSASGPVQINGSDIDFN